MDKGDHPPTSPTHGSHGYFDPANLLAGASPFTGASIPPFPPFGQIPAGYSMFGHHPLFPGAPPFGGLGSLADIGSPLRSPLQPSLSPTTSGAEWWRAASEHARHLSGHTGLDYFGAAGLGASWPPYGGLNTLDAASLDLLLRQSAAQKNLNGVFGNPLFMPPHFLSASTVATTTTARSGSRSSTPISSPTKLTSSSSVGKPSSAAKQSSVIHNSVQSPSALSPNGPMNLSGSSGGDKRRKRSSESCSSTVTSTHSPVICSVPRPVISPAVLSPNRLKEATNQSKQVESDSSGDTDSSDSDDSDSEDEDIKAKHNEPEQKMNNEEKPAAPSLSSPSTKFNIAELLKQHHQQNQEQRKQHEAAAATAQAAQIDKKRQQKRSRKDSGNESEIEPQHKRLLIEHFKQKPQLPSDISHLPPSTGSPEKNEDPKKGRGRGRGKGRPKEPVQLQSNEELEQQRARNELLKKTFEKELKQQQLALKLARKAQQIRERDAVLKVQELAKQENEKLAVNKSKAMVKTQQALFPHLTKQLQKQAAKEKQDKQGSKQDKQASKYKPRQSKLAQALLGVPISGQPETEDSEGATDLSTSQQKEARFKEFTDSLTETPASAGSEQSDGDADDSDSDGDSSNSGSSSNSDDSDSDNTGSHSNQDTLGEMGKEDRMSGTDALFPPSKKRRVIDETEVRIPLEYGWRRETRIRSVSQRGFSGEVLYFAPCGKKLRTYQEVEKYLAANDITDLTRENFAFTLKVKVGTFLEAKHGEGENGFIELSEDDMLAKFAAVQLKRQKAADRLKKKRQRKKDAQETARKAIELKMKRREEQQELARKVTEMKAKKREQKQRQIDEQRRQRHERAVAERQQKEQMKQLKIQEKLKRQEALRLEREMRAHQLLEEREVKRQQAMMLKEQERERRRQHLLLVKALEARKKQEDREKQKEEKRMEKQICREKKMEQRRMEIQMAHEMKKPIDDLQLKDLKPLPSFDRIPGVKLAGKAFSNCLMVVEFMHNFSAALGLSGRTIPSLNSLQQGLLAINDDDVAEVVSLVMHLLGIAIDDPGVPNPKEGMTALGQKIGDVILDEENLSEILRIFIKCRLGKLAPLAELLKTTPFQALSPTSQSDILGFLCDELLSNQNVQDAIENSIEAMSTMRKDKWIVEGKLRKLKTVQGRRFNKPENKVSESSINEDSSHVATPGGSKRGSDDEDDQESGNESDMGGNEGVNQSDGEEDNTATAEDLETKLEKLNKQHSQFRTKVFNASHRLRGLTFGQDRFKRHYWVLPHCGGIFVEGAESAEVGSDTDESNNESVKTDNIVKSEINKEIGNSIKQEPGNDVKIDTAIKKEVDSIKEENQPIIPANSDNLFNHSSNLAKLQHMVNGDIPHLSPKMEKIKENGPLNLDKAAIDKSQNNTNSHAVNGFPVTESICKDEQSPYHISKTDKDQRNQKLCSLNKSKENDSDSKEIQGENGSSQNGTPQKSESNFMNIDSLIQKDSQQNIFGSSFMSPDLKADQTTAGQMLKNLATSQSNQSSWFSILPRMPCDDKSITTGSLGVNNTSTPKDTPADKTVKSEPLISPYLPPTPYSAYLPSPSFASMHMAQYNSNSNFSMGENSNNSSFPCMPLDLSMPSISAPETPDKNNVNKETPEKQQQHNASSFLDQSGLQEEKARQSEDMTSISVLQHEKPQTIPIEHQHGWWRIADPNQLKAVQRCIHPRGIREKILQKNIQKYQEYAYSSCITASSEVTDLKITDMDREISQSATRAPMPDGKDAIHQDIKFDAEKSVFEDIEDLEERIFTASLQVKGWKLPPRVTDEEKLILVPSEKALNSEIEQHPLDHGRERLLGLEENIERRYLKPPFTKATTIDLTNMQTNHRAEKRLEKEREREENHENTESNDGNPEQNSAKLKDIPNALIGWRNSVAKAMNPSQLYICFQQLNKSIAWEKSIMKVLCQICLRDNNEAELLLCDNCDKGYHTYCFKPKMSSIPDGDWYCFECITTASGRPHCVVCGKTAGRMADCDNCPRAFHIDCLVPPLPRVPRKWSCATCVSDKCKPSGRRGRKPKALKDLERSTDDTTDDADKCSTPSSATSSKQNGTDDFTNCRLILSELERHDEAWPFLLPVNFKQFPQYKKVIKQPMDFQTIRNKLRDSQYDSVEEFHDDVYLVFDNCKTFNEDDSEVGDAGHIMRRYFTKRWKDITEDSD
ncbi:unnamed protein product [Owenia fusiformis]|uniref:Bromodomain adjacent to zinc finger domain protein 2B n=1 Tax=Owenia fusiformis TaxID=6347 RepID=A0A8S4MX90_OWEFU|nr:unnamed protein product [Owenia fusiformis]